MTNDMKKTAYIALATLALSACQQEVDFRVEESVPTHTVTLKAGFQPGTRTTYSDEGTFSWTAGDKIGVLVTNGTETRQVAFTTEDAKPIATFTGEVPDGFTVGEFASYPFFGDGEGDICNDLVYDAAKDGWILSGNIRPNPEKPLAGIPLVGAKDASGFFQFKTAVGIVKFIVENVPSAMLYAELQAAEPGKLAGVFALTDDGFLPMDKVVDAVDFACSYQTPADKNTTMDFYFFVPAGTLPAGTEFRLRNNAADAPLVTRVFKQPVEVAANRITKVAPIVLEPEPEYSRQTDSLALVAIYNAGDGANWKASRKWKLDEPMNTWPGIKLNEDGRVIEMSITNGTVTTVDWEIPEALADLTELSTLQIVGSKLKGEIPEFLYGMTKLAVIRLNSNNLTGALSDKIGQLTELTDLYINLNKSFGGTIPETIGQLTKLVSINIAQTAIGGEIPLTLAQCTALKNFMAWSNQLSGEIPDFWDQLPNIGVLQLYGNPGITGPIPASIGTLKAATGIQLKECNLTGNIPASFGGLEKCGNLQLNGNKLSGVVPAEVQAHPKWLATSGWKYEVNILPQQDGYGLTLE